MAMTTPVAIALDDEESSPREKLETEGHKNGDGKYRDTGSGVVKSNRLPPVCIIVRFCKDGEDGRKVSPRSCTQQEEENMKTGIALYPLESEENEPDADKSQDHGPFISPKSGKAARHEKRGAITNGVRGKEPTRLPMGEVEAVLDQGEKR